jgi:hypothetical protein
LRDALTQFDECGVIVAGSAPELWQGLCAHRWREVFVERRAVLLRTTRFVVFGHASHDLLGAPFVGLCGKALFIEVDAAWLELPAPESLARLDARLAETTCCWRLRAARLAAAATARHPRRHGGERACRLLRRRAAVPPAA